MKSFFENKKRFFSYLLFMFILISSIYFSAKIDTYLNYNQVKESIYLNYSFIRIGLESVIVVIFLSIIQDILSINSKNEEKNLDRKKNLVETYINEQIQNYKENGMRCKKIGIELNEPRYIQAGKDLIELSNSLKEKLFDNGDKMDFRLDIFIEKSREIQARIDEIE